MTDFIIVAAVLVSGFAISKAITEGSEHVARAIDRLTKEARNQREKL